jgi:hypothetical protein
LILSGTPLRALSLGYYWASRGELQHESHYVGSLSSLGHLKMKKSVLAAFWYVVTSSHL